MYFYGALNLKGVAQAYYSSLLRENNSSMFYKSITRPPTTVQSMKP
jgi:hypothetical protein